MAAAWDFDGLMIILILVSTIFNIRVFALICKRGWHVNLRQTKLWSIIFGVQQVMLNSQAGIVY